jgi:hypothetical protein
MSYQQKFREQTIRCVVPNLRFRWKNELAAYSDDAVASVYENFSLSADAGDNDEKFPEWFDQLPLHRAGD